MPLGSVRTASLSLSLSLPHRTTAAQQCIAFPSDSSRSRSRSSKKKKITFVRTDTQVLPAKAEVAALSPRTLCCGPLVVLRPALSSPNSALWIAPHSLLCSAPISLPSSTLFVTPHSSLCAPHFSLLTACSSLLNACCSLLLSACCAAPLCPSLSHFLRSPVQL